MHFWRRKGSDSNICFGKSTGVSFCFCWVYSQQSFCYHLKIITTTILLLIIIVSSLLLSSKLVLFDLVQLWIFPNFELILTLFTIIKFVFPPSDLIVNCALLSTLWLVTWFIFYFFICDFVVKLWQSC